MSSGVFASVEAWETGRILKRQLPQPQQRLGSFLRQCLVLMGGVKRGGARPRVQPGHGQAKHVFWREPTGKPYRGKEGKHSPSEVLAEVGRQSAVNSDGSLSRSFGIERFELALKLASVVICPSGEELNQSDSWGIVRKALLVSIKLAGGKKPLSPSKLLDLAEKNAADYFRKPETPYTLVSNLSVKSLPAKRIEAAGCRIEALSSREKYPYPEPR